MLMTTTLDISDPSAYDILLGRHKHCFHHVGNQAFRALIGECMPTYLTLTSKRGKMHLVTLLLEIIHQGGGQFLREGNDSLWHGVKRRTAREKISHALRDHSTRLVSQRQHSDTSSDANQDDVEEVVILDPRPCWRTIVYETVERGNQKKSSKKRDAYPDVDQVDERHFEHLDTKNLFTSASASRREVASAATATSDAGMTSIARSHASLNETRTKLLTSIPFPHYMPLTTTPASLHQHLLAKTLMNPFTGAQQYETGNQNARLNDSSEADLMLGDGRDLLGDTSSTAFAASHVGEAPFANTIPRHSRLVASARHHSLSANPLRNDDNLGFDALKSDDLQFNLPSSHRYTGLQGMDGLQMGDGNMFERASQVAAMSNLPSDVHHPPTRDLDEDDQSLDPIPLDSLPATFPASAETYAHHHDDEIIAPEPAPFLPEPPQPEQQPQQQEHHRRSHSQAQVDALLLDLFKR